MCENNHTKKIPSIVLIWKKGKSKLYKKAHSLEWAFIKVCKILNQHGYRVFNKPF